MVNLTIIIPHKNSLYSLLELLGSIPSTIEVIVVDDKSDVDIQDKLRSLSLSNVKVFFNNSKESNAGYARNIGISLLDEHCQWVMFSDADDLMNRPNLQKLITFLESEKSDVVLTGVNARFKNGKPSSRADYIKKLLNEFPGNSRRILFQWVGPIGKVVRKDFLINNQLRYESRIASNDVVFSAKLAALEPAVSVFNKNIYTIIESTNSLTATLSVEKAKARLETTWIRNRINVKSKSRVKLHYGVTLYIYILLHGSIVEKLKYFPGELKNILFALSGNINRFFINNFLK